MRGTFLPFSLPNIAEEEISEVVDSLRSGWITTGPKVKRFEEQFGEYVGSANAIAVSSCTAALHIALAALDIGVGDEVILPTLTFCSAANVVVHLRARPVLVDVGEDFNVTPEAVEKAISSRTKAIVPVHYGGQACSLLDLYEIASRHQLPVVEDAAHSVGSSYQGKKLGSDSLTTLPTEVPHATAFSFYAIKNMTTGEGGMIATRDQELADRMRLLSLHGMSRDAWNRYTSAGSWYYEVVMPGYKCNMTDIQASLGIHQLRRLDSFISVRQRYAHLYDRAFTKLAQIDTPKLHANRDHAYHLYVIRLNLDLLSIDRDQFIRELRALNIGTSVHFIPVHLHPYYQSVFGYRRGDFPCAESIYDRIISLPLYPAMSEGDVLDVIEAVNNVACRFRKY